MKHWNQQSSVYELNQLQELMALSRRRNKTTEDIEKGLLHLVHTGGATAVIHPKTNELLFTEGNVPVTNECEWLAFNKEREV